MNQSDIVAQLMFMNSMCAETLQSVRELRQDLDKEDDYEYYAAGGALLLETTLGPNLCGGQPLQLESGENFHWPALPNFSD